MWTQIINTDFKIMIWLIPICFLLHEMEEWNIRRWYESTYPDPPVSTDFSVHLWLIFISAVGFVVTLIAELVGGSVAAYLMLVFIILTIANGLQHIYWSFAFKKYAPGLVFSSVGIVLGTVVIACAVNQLLLNTIVVLCFYVLLIPVLILTVKAGNTVTKPIRMIHAFSMKLAGLRILNRKNA